MLNEMNSIPFGSKGEKETGMFGRRSIFLWGNGFKRTTVIVTTK